MGDSRDQPDDPGRETELGERDLAEPTDLERQTRDVLEHVVAMTQLRSACYPIAREAAQWVATFGEPMRVAVVGEIKTGKSTLVNGLVGADAALSVTDADQTLAMETGQLETTYVLTELVHGAPTGIVVHYRDGTEAPAELRELRALTVRRDAADRTLQAIARVVVTINAPLLERFRLIDTPGFDSVYEHDSAASLRLLTSTECDRAGAIVYTIENRGLTGVSEKIARQFVGGAGSAAITPMKAIGVMPRSNERWPELVGAKFLRSDPDLDVDPLAQARAEIDRVLTPADRGLFHAIVPVAGLLAEGAALADDRLLAAFEELTNVNQAELARSLIMPKTRYAFATAADLRALEPAVRQQLVKTFSAYGVWVGVQAVRKHPGLPKPELRQILDEQSGVAELRDLIGNHFGARASTLRVRDALAQLLRTTGNHRRPMPQEHDDYAVLEDVGRRLERFKLSHDVRFDVIDVLGRHYRGQLRLTPAEVEDLLRLSGERGMDPAARLGLPSTASRAQLRAAAVAAGQRWSRIGGRGMATTNAAAALARACDELIGFLDGQR